MQVSTYIQEHNQVKISMCNRNNVELCHIEGETVKILKWCKSHYLQSSYEVYHCWCHFVNSLG